MTVYFISLLGCWSVCVSVFRFLWFVLVSYYAMQINALSISLHRKEQLASRINTIPSQIVTLYNAKFTQRTMVLNRNINYISVCRGLIKIRALHKRQIYIDKKAMLDNMNMHKQIIE